MSHLDENLAANADETLDVTGLVCPEPLMLLRNRVRELPPGTRIYAVATDPSTRRDFDSFCRFLGHTLEHAESRDDGHLHFIIRKGQGGAGR